MTTRFGFPPNWSSGEDNEEATPTQKKNNSFGRRSYSSPPTYCRRSDTPSRRFCNPRTAKKASPIRKNSPAASSEPTGIAVNLNSFADYSHESDSYLNPLTKRLFFFSFPLILLELKSTKPRTYI